MESPRQSELVYNYNRDYDPQTGRYIESDPIGLQGGINGYLYANADPLSFIDPEGLTGNSAQRRGARRAQPPGSASPSTNDPGNTEDTLGV